MEYFGNTFCISARELLKEGVMSKSCYEKMVSRKRIKLARIGHGPGVYALVALESLPDKYRKKVEELHPEGRHEHLICWFAQNYETDQHAVAFFHDKNETGVELKPEKIAEYVTNASVLNACIKLYKDTKAVQRTMGMRYDWNQMTTVVEGLREKYNHTLPSSMFRFRKKVSEYKKFGYGCLISGKYGNQNSRVVNCRMEHLIVSIAAQPNKPFDNNVHEIYNAFVCGELEVYDVETGELYNPEDFCDKNGDPRPLSESTIRIYLNRPKNRVLIEHALSSWSTFMHEQRPFVHREAPDFSFSKISFDDRDLPRKLKDTKQRPKAYYAYDVASQCVVGSAYSRDKDVDLVVNMFRDMFRLIDRKGWGCPAEVEVENHLMSQWKDSFLKAGGLFKFVRFCAPLNSQEKYAEPLNGAKKRSIEHKNHIDIGRFYAKDRHYRVDSRKVSDEKNDTYEDKKYYSWEELIADDKADIEEWNNTLHPNQKLYPEMTRWQVLESRMNPDLLPYDHSVLARYIGDHVETTVRRNSFCRVSYTDWWLSSTSVLTRLAPNNYKVDAYFIPEEDGTISDVYIYQNGKFIDKLQNIGTFKSAAAEQTDKDREIFTEQQKKISSFDKYIKDNAITKVGITRPTRETEPEQMEAEALPEPEMEPEKYCPEDYAAMAFEQI